MTSNPWLDVTELGVYSRDPVSIRVGRADWSGRADSASGTATFANRDGRWSPDNPTGPYHQQLVRNMPVRYGVESEGDAWVEWTESDDGTDVISTDDASLDITGDIDIRIEIAPTYDLVPVSSGGSFHRLASRSAGAAGWRLLMADTNGELDLLLQWWESGGTARTVNFSNSGTQLPRSILWTRTAIKVTLDVSTGDVEWSLATAINGSYTAAGTSSVGATSIGTVSTDLVLGGLPVSPSIAALRGRVHAFQARDAIDGTPVADLDLTGEAPGTTAITDDAGVDWAVGDQGRITDTLWRLHGEVASWPTRWDISGNDKWVPIEANGLLRRLRQGRGALRSPLRRGIIRERLSTSVVDYWTMEDKGDQTLRRMGPAIGTKVLVKYGGTANPASNSDFVASDAIPTLDDDIWVTNVDSYPVTDQWMVRCLFSAPADASAGDDVDFLEVVTTSLTWVVRFTASTGGDLRLLGYDQEGTNVYDSTSADFNINGRPVRLSLSAEQTGASIEVRLSTTDVSGVIGGISSSVSTTAGAVKRLRLNKNGDSTKLAVGHLTVESVVRTGDLLEDLAAYDGETAVERVRRLCIEEGIDFRIRGDLDDSTRMGPQSVASLADLLQEVADTDLGILFDAPDRVAVAYRTGAQIRNQADVTFDYSAGEIGGTPKLDRDDQGFANDITVVNWDGAEYRAQVLSGPTSIFAPPSGVGRYDAQYRMSLDNPDAMEDHANARLSLRSVDEPRLSELRLGLHLDAVDAALRAQILALGPGDRINVIGLLADVYPTPLPQIIQGWTETIDRFEHWIHVNTTSAEPWDTGVIEGGPIAARYDTAGAELAAGVTALDASMSVATTSGPLWTTDAGDAPFDVLADGVRVTVTAVSGSSSPQTFTVTGATVVRDLASGGDVRLADPIVYAL